MEKGKLCKKMEDKKTIKKNKNYASHTAHQSLLMKSILPDQWAMTGQLVRLGLQYLCRERYW